MKITDNKLNQKAKMVVYAIHLATQQFNKTVYGEIKGVKPINELSEASEKDKGVVTYLTMVSFLFQAQKYFWERVITDKEIAKKFENLIYEIFIQLTEVDPKPYILDIGDYIERQGKEGELMYLGSKICKELKNEGAILMMEINTVFSSLLIHGYFESLKNAWEYVPKDEK